MVDLSVAALWAYVTSLHVVDESYVEFLAINGAILVVGAVLAAWGAWGLRRLLMHPKTALKLATDDFDAITNEEVEVVDPEWRYRDFMYDCNTRKHVLLPDGRCLMYWLGKDFARKVKRHVVFELAYDIVQAALTMWLLENVHLKEGEEDYPGKLVLNFLNFATTGVDLLLVKGPEFALAVAATPSEVPQKLQEVFTELYKDKAPNQTDIFQPSRHLLAQA